ncbi:alpha/beta fold hydrolase [Bacillus solimangrovi]|uniref:AB hydrolase-1 domain-containing protein n=1 Tax=Bacillus solimangrovi TaxID=1305675 RepID=A0A1E5LGM9_9BACI|nr:alpha/beta hydrolase [Bacillus solimangrovi]OEH93237.1 hypothetical protein BFG57_12605 [Bacillus solimangrovi]
MAIIKGFHVEKYGENGMPIVFIHPPMMGKQVFMYQEELANDYQVIFYDQRGHGQTIHREGEMSIKQMAEDLYKVINGLNLEKVVLCGYSSGGYIAQQFAIMYPTRTRAIILLGGFPQVHTFWLKHEFHAGIILLKWRAQHLLSEILAQGHAITKADRKKLYHYAIKSHIPSVISLYEAGLTYAVPDLTTIDQPMFLIYGAKDEYIHAYIKDYVRIVPETQFFLVGDNFHQLPTKGHLGLNPCLRSILEKLRE